MEKETPDAISSHRESSAQSADPFTITGHGVRRKKEDR